MVVTCSVPFCLSRKNKTNGISFHEFPSDVNVRAAWLKAISRQGEQKGSEWIPSDSAKVCSVHFCSTDYNPTTKRKVLWKNAVPSIFPDYPSHKSKKTAKKIRYLLDHNFHYVLSRNLTSDDIEMFFGHLRHKGGFNDTMDVRTCIYAIESTLQTGIIAGSRHGNVKLRETSYVASSGLLKPDRKNVTKNPEAVISLPPHVLQILQRPLQGSIPTVATVSIAMVGGYLVKVAEETTDCHDCLSKISVASNGSATLTLISFQDRGGLHYPSPSFIALLKMERFQKEIMCGQCQSGKQLSQTLLKKFLSPLLDNIGRRETNLQQKKMSSTEEEEETEDDFDMSDSDSSGDEDRNNTEGATSTNPVNDANKKEGQEEDEDDELVKAIIALKEKPREHPPDLSFEDLIVDISFHPGENIIAAASIVGDVFLYKYGNEANELMDTLELHTKACRDVEFSEDGLILYSCAKDKCIMLTDIPSGKLKKFYDNAHEDPLYSLYVLSEQLFCTGDENGTVKLWDIRQDTPIITFKEMEDFVSDMVTTDAKKYLVCSSGEGSITTFNLTARKLFVQSEEYEAELNCMQLFKQENKLLVGSSKGKMYLFNWGEFGYHSDEFMGPKRSINSMMAITENIAVAGYDDGNIRAVNLFPHRHLGIVGQHDFSVESIDISHDGEFIASSSLDQTIKFWNIKYFEELHVTKQKVNNKRAGLQRNLPSSQYKDSSEFFSGLA